MTAMGSTWTSIDLSNNPRLGGGLGRWLLDMPWLKTLNLSATNVSGQLPPLEPGLVNLTTLDLSGTAVKGYIPPMPSTLKDCRLPATALCNHALAAWTPTIPKSCLTGIKSCTDVPPTDLVPPPFPNPNLPHFSQVDPPYEQYGLKPIDQQCKLLRTWLVAHGAISSMLWAESESCCPNFRDEEVGSTLIVDCEAWGVTRVEVNKQPKSKYVLSGDMNLPANTMSELKGLRYADFGSQNFTGTFPLWAAELNDLEFLNFFGNAVSGTIPDMRRVEFFNQLSFSRNNFSGPVPQLKNKVTLEGGHQAGFGLCDMRPGNGGLCWKYHPAYYDTVCLLANSAIPWCQEKVPTPPVYGPTSFSCIPTCDGSGQFLSVRKDNGQFNDSISCAGPAENSCTRFVDDKCSVVAPYSRAAVSGGGAKCLYNDDWCAVAASFLNDGATKCIGGPWKCTQICARGGKWIRARSFGAAVGAPYVQCQGSNSSSCTFYTDENCSLLAPNETAAATSGEEGFICSDVDEEWCFSAFGVVRYNATQDCGNWSPMPTPTVGVVVPTGSLAPPSGASVVVASETAKAVRFTSSEGAIGCSGSSCKFVEGAGDSFLPSCGASTNNCTTFALVSSKDSTKCLVGEDAGTVRKLRLFPCTVTRQKRQQGSYLALWRTLKATGDGDAQARLCFADADPSDIGCLLRRNGTGAVVFGAWNNTNAVWTLADPAVTTSTGAGVTPTSTLVPVETPSGGANVGAIVGGVVGGVVALAGIVGLGYYFHRRGKSLKEVADASTEEGKPEISEPSKTLIESAPRGGVEPSK